MKKYKCIKCGNEVESHYYCKDCKKCEDCWEGICEITLEEWEKDRTKQELHKLSVVKGQEE